MYMYHYLNTHAVNNRLHIEIHILKSKLILSQLVVKRYHGATFYICIYIICKVSEVGFDSIETNSNGNKTFKLIIWIK